MLCFVQDGKVEQKWKWPLGRLQTTVTVQVQYSPCCDLKKKKTFVKLAIEFTLFRARAGKFRLIDRFKSARAHWLICNFEIDGALYLSREPNKQSWILV